MAAVTLLLLAAGGGLIGFLLSVLGAGGSILLLPLLVSGAALPTRDAVPVSLLVVMLLALGNLVPYLSRRQFASRPALILGLPALAGSWIGGSWVKAGHVSEPMQLLVFASAALVASWLLTRPQRRHPTTASDRRPTAFALAALPLTLSLLLGARRILISLPMQGLLVGLLTGVAGVGGGFAIMPALVLLAGLPMALASGTSLLLIAVNALVAFAALGHWPASSWSLIVPLLLGGAIGAFVGQRLASRFSDQHLRQGFAALLIGSALLTGVEASHRQDVAQRSPHLAEPVHSVVPAASPRHSSAGRSRG